MAVVLSVNLGTVRSVSPKIARTAIDRRPVDGPVLVRAPGPAKGRSGLGGDELGSDVHHGGDDQAVYAYAREDLDAWQDELGQPLPAGVFGENLTTAGLDVTGALVGERWRIGDELVLQVTVPRIPCTTFSTWIGVPGWIKTFTRRAVPGAYLKVVHPGTVKAGDTVTVTDRPDHDVTIGLVFRALTLESELLPRLLIADDLPDETKDIARRRTPFALDADSV
jgi:MOSC domain-containing protein YiiM